MMLFYCAVVNAAEEVIFYITFYLLGLATLAILLTMRHGKRSVSATNWVCVAAISWAALCQWSLMLENLYISVSMLAVIISMYVILHWWHYTD